MHALLGLGADPCAKNSKGKTPRSLAEEEENDDVTKTLRKHEQDKGCEPEKKKREPYNLSIYQKEKAAASPPPGAAPQFRA